MSIKTCCPVKGTVSIKPELIWEDCLGGLLGSECFLKTLKQFFKWKQYKNANAFLFKRKGIYSGEVGL